MKQYISIIFTLFSLLSSFSCSNTTANSTQPPIASNFRVSSYVRGNFYNMGRISNDAINACSDIICLGVEPLADGSLEIETFITTSDYKVSNVKQLIKIIKSNLESNSSPTVRLGISGGSQWKDMISSDNSRNTFINNISQILSDVNADGVDLDFEWPTNQQEYDNYSNFIIELRNTLGSQLVISASLHPLYYKISESAIEHLDYVSLQCYGPNPDLFSYDSYTKYINEVIDYGIPNNKLTPGIPFFGIASDGSKESTTYYSLIESKAVTSANDSTAYYDGINYTLNGVNIVKRKTIYAIQNHLDGVMCWSLATDAPFGNSLSLLKSISNTIKNPIAE